MATDEFVVNIMRSIEEMKPTKKQINKAVKKIMFLVDLSHAHNWPNPYNWTEKGYNTTKWPKDFSKDERKMLREIAKRVLSTVK
jgi:hypothetical protein